jgi:hypothetical protein
MPQVFDATYFRKEKELKFNWDVENDGNLVVAELEIEITEVLSNQTINISLFGFFLNLYNNKLKKRNKLGLILNIADLFYKLIDF